jgi:hypothetical protein
MLKLALKTAMAVGVIGMNLSGIDTTQSAITTNIYDF